MKNRSRKASKWSIVGSVGAALGVAACCLGPLVLVSLGVTGAWVGSLSALDTYRPAFMVVAAGLLGLGFYRVYARSEPEDCGEGAECEVPKADRINQISIWVAAVLVAGLFASPYLLGLGLEEPTPKPEMGAAGDDSRESVGVRPADAHETGEHHVVTVTLAVEKMTCGGCARSVQTALRGVDGVEDARVTFEPPRARVTYHPSRVGVEELERVTAEIGYPSSPES